MEKIKNYKYFSLLRNIIKFEIFYKLLILFLLSPILRVILQEYLDNVGYGIAFNENMIYPFLSLPGIIIFLFLSLCMIMIIFYEIYVVMNIIALDCQDKHFSLRKIILMSFKNLQSLHYPSLIIGGIYIVLLLPLVHMGYLNSYVSRWDIPNFIFGELKLSFQGQILIGIIYIFYYMIFFMMIFVPVYMVLKRVPFFQSIKKSYSLLKTITSKQKLQIIAIMSLWIIVESFIMHILPYPLLHNRDFNWYFLKYFINFSTFRYSVIQYIFLFLIAIIAMTFFIRYIILLTLQYENQLITVDQLPIETDHLNQKLKKIQTKSKETLKKIKEKLCQFQLYQKHKKISIAIILLCIVCLLSLYLHQDALVHKPWVIGHRGSGYYVENTYEAVKDANDSGADYAEIDIQLSKDGIPIVFHDTSLSRLANKNEKLSDLTATQLEDTKLFSHNKEAYMTTLENLIIKMKDEKLDIGLLIELKPSGDVEEMANKIIDIIEKYQFSKQAIFMSLNYESIQIINQKKPEWWVGYCIYSSVGDIDDSIWDMDIDFLAMEENRASTEMIQKAVKQMIPIYIWTVDNTKKMKQYLDMGVCGLITNYPDLGKTVIDEHNKNEFHYYDYKGKGYPQQSW